MDETTDDTRARLSDVQAVEVHAYYLIDGITYSGLDSRGCGLHLVSIFVRRNQLVNSSPVLCALGGFMFIRSTPS